MMQADVGAAVGLGEAARARSRRRAWLAPVRADLRWQVPAIASSVESLAHSGLRLRDHAVAIGLHLRRRCRPACRTSRARSTSAGMYWSVHVRLRVNTWTHSVWLIGAGARRACGVARLRTAGAAGERSAGRGRARAGDGTWRAPLVSGSRAGIRRTPTATRIQVIDGDAAAEDAGWSVDSAKPCSRYGSGSLQRVGVADDVVAGRRRGRTTTPVIAANTIAEGQRADDRQPLRVGVARELDAR